VSMPKSDASCANDSAAGVSDGNRFTRPKVVRPELNKFSGDRNIRLDCQPGCSGEWTVLCLAATDISTENQTWTIFRRWNVL